MECGLVLDKMGNPGPGCTFGAGGVYSGCSYTHNYSFELNDRSLL
jgi:hypothetical protein